MVLLFENVLERFKITVKVLRPHSCRVEMIAKCVQIGQMQFWQFTSHLSPAHGASGINQPVLPGWIKLKYSLEKKKGEQLASPSDFLDRTKG